MGGLVDYICQALRPFRDNETDVFFAQRDVVNATTINGSFLEPLADQLDACEFFFSLKCGLHDWGDEACVRILVCIKQCAKPDASIVV